MLGAQPGNGVEFFYLRLKQSGHTRQWVGAARFRRTTRGALPLRLNEESRTKMLHSVADQVYPAS